jgi:4-hydroxy-3-methylbut-2-en-1-yl diphosphate reductase
VILCRMEVIKVSPRGYCYGVVDAMKLARQAAKDPTLPRPLYIIGLIVHNRFAVQELSELGITTLDGPDRASILEQVTEGTVIFTAHGVSPRVKQRAIERGLHVLDATCPDVTRTHDLVKDFTARGYKTIYIGKKGHPEPEGVIGEAPESVYLVETAADLDSLPASLATYPRLLVTTQTTLSQWDTARLTEQIRERYPQVEVCNEICMATQLRQEAVAKMALGADLTIVVGDPRSNNTARLVQVAEEMAGSPAIRIECLSDLRPEVLSGKKRIAITSGTSTPTLLTRQVIDFVESFGARVRLVPPPEEQASGEDSSAQQ